MTHEHFLFIPTVFFLGFFFGGMIALKSKHESFSVQEREITIKDTIKSGSVYTLGLAFFIFLSVFILTHILPLFGGSKALSLVLKGRPFLDQHPVFSIIDLLHRLNDYGEFGRAKYKQFTYTVDVLFPLAFLVFLLMLTRFLLERTTLSKNTKHKFMLLPMIWFMTDMIENSIIFCLLVQFPTVNEFLGRLLGFVTVSKFSLLLFSVANPTILGVLYRRKQFGESWF